MGTAQTKFWTEIQNNSQGVFDHDPDAGIGYALCVEATDADHATARMKAIVDGYAQGPYCPCCGERWYTEAYGDGADAPSLYGEALRGGWGMPSYVHYLDGRIEAVAEQVPA